MDKVKRRNKKHCQYYSQEQSSIGYCTNPKAGWLFCDGVCQYFKLNKSHKFLTDKAGLVKE